MPDLARVLVLIRFAVLFLFQFQSSTTDTLTLKTRDGNAVRVLNTGIAWPSDKQFKFRNPEKGNLTLQESRVPRVLMLGKP